MQVTPLLSITAVLLLVSGVVKLRAVTRVGVGIGILPLAEVVAAFVLLGLAVLARPNATVGLWAIVGGVLLLLGSSFQVGASLGRRRRARERSEAARLQTYLRYLSPSIDPGARATLTGEGEGRLTDRSAPMHHRHPRVQRNDPPGTGESG